MPTLAGWTGRRIERGAASVSMAPGPQIRKFLFGIGRCRAFSGIGDFRQTPLTPALSHGRLTGRARGRRWRPWARGWVVARKWGPLPNGVVVRGCDENSGKIAVMSVWRGFFVVGGRCALRVLDAHREWVKCRWGKKE